MQHPSKITTNNSQRIVFAIISCQRVHFCTNPPSSKRVIFLGVPDFVKNHVHFGPSRSSIPSGSTAATLYRSTFEHVMEVGPLFEEVRFPVLLFLGSLDFLGKSEARNFLGYFGCCFLCLFQGFCGFGRDRKSLVILRFSLIPKNQGKEGQGWEPGWVSRALWARNPEKV